MRQIHGDSQDLGESVTVCVRVLDRRISYPPFSLSPILKLLRLLSQWPLPKQLTTCLPVCPSVLSNADDPGADTATFQDDGQQRQHQQSQQRGRLPARSKLAPELQIPNNRSSGNLPAVAEADSDAADHKPGFRFSFDAGPVSAESDSNKRYVLP